MWYERQENYQSENRAYIYLLRIFVSNKQTKNVKKRQKKVNIDYEKCTVVYKIKIFYKSS